MKAHYADDRATVFNGDCIDVMRCWADESVDAIVTDPPYGLGFMGHKWDHMPPGVEWAEECLRVLKPGGHLLAFGGSRTWHRLAVAIEDAGFEVRDSIAWLYGSGFPKSLDVSKAIDKRRDWSLVERLSGEIRRARAEAGLSLAEIGQATLDATDGTYGKWYHRGGHMFFETGRSLPSRPEWEHLRHVLPIAPEFAEVYDEAERAVIRERTMTQGGGTSLQMRMGEVREVRADITAPATPEAERWQGWGSAMKPGFEPVVVARKPLIGTIAQNVLTYGTGALNIDACRISASGQSPDAGRWPANVVLDESQAEVLDEQSGASRFFPTFRYQAKAPRSERPKVNGVAHPTVKPVALMRWLVRLVTPPDGVVLDPFAGSGATLEAALLEGFQCVGIELADEYLPLIVHRIERAQAGHDEGAAEPLFKMEGEVG